jgi:hypothetical protein
VTHEGTRYVTKRVSDLNDGVNVGSAVKARAVVDATATDAAGHNGGAEQLGALNLHYVAVDAAGARFAISVYGLEDGAVRMSSTLTLLNPDVRDVDVQWNGRRYAFRLVRVDLPKQILVGGKMPVGRIARPRMASTNL